MDTTTSSRNVSSIVSSACPPIRSIHHVAVRCCDAAETRKFYEGVLGLDCAVAAVFKDDGFGHQIDFMHIFFRMAEGDFVAFFDLPSDIRPDMFTPYGETDLRLALKVSTEDELLALAARLSAAGVKYSGPSDFGFIKSIFFKDPNGFNVEIAATMPRHDAILAEEKARARNVLAAWTKETAARKAGVERPVLGA